MMYAGRWEASLLRKTRRPTDERAPFAVTCVSLTKLINGIERQMYSGFRPFRERHHHSGMTIGNNPFWAF
jgi:hypothetical protein